MSQTDLGLGQSFTTFIFLDFIFIFFDNIIYPKKHISSW